MQLICYLYEPDGQVPHMEVLPEASLSEARALAVALLHQRPNYDRAELWNGETMVSRFAQTPRRRPLPDSGSESFAL